MTAKNIHRSSFVKKTESVSPSSTVTSKTHMALDLDGLFLTNDSFDYSDYEYNLENDRLPYTMAVFMPVLYSLVLVLGLLGNILVLAVLLHLRRSWSVMDNFILHMCMANTLLLITLPLWAVQAAQDWIFGTPLCKLTASTFKIHFFCGIFLLACISLDRYLSIVHAVQMYSRRKLWQVQASCLSVWFFCLLLSAPDWIFLEAVKDERREKVECIHNYVPNQEGFDWRLISRLLYHIMGFFIPSAVMLFCYSCILWRLHQGSQGTQKQRAIRVILALVVAFLVCWTPYNLTLMVDTVRGQNGVLLDAKGNPLKEGLMFTAALGCINCGLNPLLLIWICGNFRRHLLHMLKWHSGELANHEISLWTSDDLSPGCAKENDTNEMSPLGQTTNDCMELGKR